MCVSNDAKSIEKTGFKSQIIKNEHEIRDPILAINKQLQHHKESENHSEKSPIEPPTALQLQSEDSKLLGSSKNEFSPRPTSLVSQDHEIVHRLSPKKKRSRDQIEEVKEQEKQVLEKSEIEQEKHATPIRASSSEPEKKRPRDASEPTKIPTNQEEAKYTTLQAPKDVEQTGNVQINKKADESDINSDPTPAENLEKPKLLFANSGFASLAASSVSPFGSLGLSKSSVFGGGLNNKCGTDPSKMSPNVILSNASSTSDNLLGKGASAPLSFSDKTVLSVGSESVFTSAFGNSGFSSNAGPKLSSFATPGSEINTLKTKELRVFGAPEIGNANDSKVSNSDGNNHAKNNDKMKNVSVGNEEKLKAKIKIDDGEADEVTLLQIRAKLFAIESKILGWKERGVGTLKINVTKQSVRYDKNEIPIPGTFNKSNKKGNNISNKDNSSAARLIMRQENTHRVVLNTFILREMEFEEKPAVSSAQFIFTALEGEKELKPVRLLLKMSEINAKLFRAEIDSIQSNL